MNRWLKFGVSAIMGFSALMKLLDFENTEIYFQRLSGFGSETVGVSLALLIFSEMLIAFTLPIDWRGQRMIQDATLSILTLFLGLSLTMAFTGMGNCGCFGTTWVSHPWLTVVKNLALIAIMVRLRYDFGAHKHA